MGECQQGKFDGDGYILVQHSHRLPIRVRSENRRSYSGVLCVGHVFVVFNLITLRHSLIILISSQL